MPRKLLLSLAIGLMVAAAALLGYTLQQPNIASAVAVSDPSNASAGVLRNCLKSPQVELCKSPEVSALVAKASLAAFDTIAAVHRVLMPIVTLLVGAALIALAVLVDLARAPRPSSSSDQ